MKYWAMTRATTDLPTPPFSPPMKWMFATENEWLGPAFGFHGIWNMPRFLPEADIRYAIENMPIRFWKDHSKVLAFAKTLREYGFDSLLDLCAEKIKITNKF